MCPPDNLPPVSLSDLDAAPVNLGTPPQSTGPEKPEEFIAKFTAVADENFELKTEIDALRKQVRTAQILDSLIKPYARATFAFMCSYCGFVGVLLLLSGWAPLRFSLPKEVMTVMVGSTAATVIGLVGMVLTGIFVGARRSGG